ncbi:hypothetical protein WUBG_06556 [Wuchereria bancrofti]|uniref:Uncharacterized protein n=1 Tax=Wuchereria bancrofti TaxID=6293 RepID=J9EK52_WUCBA|nr:hypothetical protein WUBG_06556 [Wuchereria bancrofti]VDM19144.1 unnamed protein product [Wuchereria bancrofti]
MKQCSLKLMEYRYYSVAVTFTSLFNPHRAESTRLCDVGCGFDDLFSSIDLSENNFENTVSSLFSDNLLTFLQIRYFIIIIHQSNFNIGFIYDVRRALFTRNLKMKTANTLT